MPNWILPATAAPVNHSEPSHLSPLSNMVPLLPCTPLLAPLQHTVRALRLGSLRKNTGTLQGHTGWMARGPISVSHLTPSALCFALVSSRTLDPPMEVWLQEGSGGCWANEKECSSWPSITSNMFYALGRSQGLPLWREGRNRLCRWRQG